MFLVLHRYTPLSLNNLPYGNRRANEDAPVNVCRCG